MKFVSAFVLAALVGAAQQGIAAVPCAYGAPPTTSVPGLDTGTDQFGAVDAVMKWVEHGERPKQIAASRGTAGKVDRTRPLCTYPQVAKYKSAGSTDDAANFSCTEIH